MGSQSEIFSPFIRARLLVFFVLFLLPLVLTAQLSGTAELNPSFVEKGEIFSVKFTFANDITSTLSVVEPELPEGLEKVGDSILSFDTRENQTKMEFSFRSSEEGFITIPPFIFREGRRQEWKSGPISIGISVSRIGIKDEDTAVELELRLAKGSVYQNESVGVGLFTVGNQRLTYLDLVSLQVNFPVSLKVEKMPLFWEMRLEKTDKGDMLHRPLMNWILTPREKAEITLPIISLEKDGHRYKTKPLNLAVRKLDQDLEFWAVGNFDMTTGISSREVSGAGTVELTVAVTGEGNFNQFIFPSINVEDGVIVAFGEENSLQPTEKGFKGSLFRIYKIAPTSSNNLQISVPNWTYWDVDQGISKEIEGSIYSVRVTSKVLQIPLSLKEKGSNLTFLSETEMRSHKFSFLFVNSLYYLALVPGIVLAIFLFFKRLLWRVLSLLTLFLFACALVGLFWLGERRVSNSQDVLDTLKWSELQEQQEALLLEIDNLLSRSIPPYYRANLLYNKGILLFKMNHEQEAIGSLYSALQEAPLHVPAGDAVRVISLGLGKAEIISFQDIYWLNWLFLFALITFNVIWISCFIFRQDTVARFFSLLILSFALLVELFFFLNFIRQIYTPLGVLHGSMVSVSKVPDFFTRSWIFTNGGLAVYIVEETDYFYRISLPSGIQGWVEKSSVWKLR